MSTPSRAAPRLPLTPLEAEAQTFQPKLHDEITAALSDFRTILERTLTAENGAYGNEQFSEADIRAALGDSMLAAVEPIRWTDTRAKLTAGGLHQLPSRRRGSKKPELHQACAAGDVETTMHLVQAMDCVNSRAPDSNTPLYLAVKHGHHQLAEYLLEANADPSIVCGGHYIPPLHEAAKQKDARMIKLLIKNGADRNQKSTFGEGVTAFEYPINIKTWSALKNTPGPNDSFVAPAFAKADVAATPTVVTKGTRSASLQRRSSVTPKGAATMAVDKAPKKPPTRETKHNGVKQRKLFPAAEKASRPPPWGPMVFTARTEFFLGKNANDALLLAGRGRLWGKHKEIFRHSCTREEKQYLLDHGNAPSKGVGLKATLVLASQIRNLTTGHPHYSDNPTIQANVAALNCFTLSEAILKAVSAGGEWSTSGIRFGCGVAFVWCWSPPPPLSVSL